MLADRITPTISFRNFLVNLGEVRRQIERANLQVTSGRRLNSASDDPAAAGELLRVQAQVDRFEQFARNGFDAEGRLRFTESVLNSVINLLSLALEKGVAGASDTQSAQTRSFLAQEVDRIKEQVLSLANSSFSGNFIFAGSKVDTRPFVVGPMGGVVYAGDGLGNLIEIGDNIKVRSNIPGSEIFIAAAGSIFDALDALAAALQANDSAQITSALSQLSAARLPVETARAEIGSSLATIDKIRSQLQSQKLELVRRVSELRNSDLARAISDLLQAEAAQRATLAIGARLPAGSLFDFLA